MIAEKLHKAMQDAGCGPVKVDAEDSPARFSLPSRTTGMDSRGAFPSVYSWGEVHRMNCPFCGDKRQRLFVCHLAGAKVTIPGRSGAIRFSDFIAVCHNERCHAENPRFRAWWLSVLQNRPFEMSLNELTAPKRMSSMSHLFTTVTRQLPVPCYSLTSSMVPAAVHEYLIGRKFCPYELQMNHLVGYSPAGATYELDDPEKKEGVLREARIIVPVMAGRRIVGWQGRVARDVSKEEHVPKYFTCPGMHKDNVWYNMDNALLGNLAVIVEGVFDVWRVGVPGICPLGKTISDQQKLLLKLLFGQNGGCLVMLDPDAHQRTYTMAMELSQLGIFPRGVIPVYLRDKDPASTTTAEMRTILEGHMAQLIIPKAREMSPDDFKEMEGYETLEGDDDDTSPGGTDSM